MSVWVPSMRIGSPSALRENTLPTERIHRYPPSLWRSRNSVAYVARLPAR